MLPLAEFTYNNSYHREGEEDTGLNACNSESVGDHVFLRVTSTAGIGRALKSRKLTPRFIGPYQIIKRIGPVAYEIALPPHLANLHNVFHVSQLRKYMPDPTHVLEEDDVQIQEDLTIGVGPVRDQNNKGSLGRGYPGDDVGDGRCHEEVISSPISW